LDSRDPRKFLAGKWEPRGWQWVDPLKDVQASILAIGAKLTSRDEVIAEKGGDVEDVFEQLKEEDQLGEAMGLDLTLPDTQKPSSGGQDTTTEEEDAQDGGKDDATESDSKKKSAQLVALRG
jgi:capsid protein